MAILHPRRGAAALGTALTMAALGTLLPAMPGWAADAASRPASLSEAGAPPVPGASWPLPHNGPQPTLPRPSTRLATTATPDVRAISPADIIASPGDTVTFSASVSMPQEGMVHQWQASNDAGATWWDIPGAAASTYTLLNATAQQSGLMYRALITGFDFSIFSSPATLTVSAKASTPAPPASADPALGTWIASRTGVYLDFDQHYGAQCVDLVDFYLAEHLKVPVPWVSGAKDLWGMPGVLADRLTRVPPTEPARPGDIAVWGETWGGGYGHVAVVVEPLGTGRVKALNNNWNSDSRSVSTVNEITTEGLLGYLRPTGK